MRAVGIIQARCGSTRLPGKVLKPLAAQSVLFYVVRRCQLSRSLADLVVATTIEPADDVIEDYCRTLGVPVYRGSRDDVLLRYVEAGDWSHADPIVRITSDCPLIEPAVIDAVIEAYSRADADYAFIQGYPRGVGDAEVMSLAALRKALAETSPLDTGYREHVMTYLTDHPEKFRLCIAEARRRRKTQRCVCASMSRTIWKSFGRFVAILRRESISSLQKSSLSSKSVRKLRRSTGTSCKKRSKEHSPKAQARTAIASLVGASPSA